MLRLAFDFIITWRETRTRPNAYIVSGKEVRRYKRKEDTVERQRGKIKGR